MSMNMCLSCLTWYPVYACYTWRQEDNIIFPLTGVAEMWMAIQLLEIECISSVGRANAIKPWAFFHSQITPTYSIRNLYFFKMLITIGNGLHLFISCINNFDNNTASALSLQIHIIYISQSFIKYFYFVFKGTLIPTWC